MKSALEWKRAALLQSPLFTPLHPILANLDVGDFPTLHDCNALLATHPSAITVQNGKPVRFVPQQGGKLLFADQYEPRCYLEGEVQMRANNWHDLFNALVWLTFPKTKAVLNARHYYALVDQMESGAAGRGTVRDVNTLFDESGVIVAYAHQELAGLLRNFNWKELFWQRREQVRPQSSRQTMGFYLIGHGLYEKALQPYVGMTGQGLLLEVEEKFFSWLQPQQLAHLDNLLAEYLAVPGHCRSTRELAPVPLLGLPGWAAGNERVEYYDNTDYFRSGRRNKAKRY